MEIFCKLLKASNKARVADFISGTQPSTIFSDRYFPIFYTFYMAFEINLLF